MGLTIHYEGRFNPDCSLQQMVDELLDIAKIHHWTYDIFETNFPMKNGNFVATDKYDYDTENIYGIAIGPPDSEGLYFTFLSNGYTSMPTSLEFWGKETNRERREYVFGSFTKTQFAGAKMHQAIIHLFRYITQKYYLEFKMSDETGYWKHNDEKKLNEAFSYSNRIIDALQDRLENTPKASGEDLIAFINRIAEETKKGLDEGEK
jgi:hypothetical protein